jgi:hypothetical protein
MTSIGSQLGLNRTQILEDLVKHLQSSSAYILLREEPEDNKAKTGTRPRDTNRQH